MSTASRPPSTSCTVLTGLAGLAAAMGIGRFAFTPLLPLMQAESLTLAQGAWLAGANYLGYLMGALACAAVNPPPHRAARLGLAAVALSTLGMAFSSSPSAWLVLRWAAGVASAFVLVGISGWAPAWLAAQGRPHAAGGVYAGVGIGMVLAGVAALAVGLAAQPAAAGWGWLGAIAALVSVLAWRALQQPAPAPARRAAPAAALSAGSAARLVACYGAFGFGYILPATFLPAMARTLVDDPAVFGWTWPVFGLAAALSTGVGALLWRHLSPRALWAGSQVVMAAGVLLPVLAPHSLTALAASAVCIGGTFMVATMAGLQEARRVAGAAAPRLMAAMTAAFGAGQLIGPLAVAALGSEGSGLLSGVAAGLLLASSAALLLQERPATVTAPPTEPRSSP